MLLMVLFLVRNLSKGSSQFWGSSSLWLFSWSSLTLGLDGCLWGILMLGSLIVIVVDGITWIVMLFGTVFKTITVLSIIMVVDELSFVLNLGSSLSTSQFSWSSSLCGSSWSSISLFRIIMISFFALLSLCTILKTIAFLSIEMIIDKLFILWGLSNRKSLLGRSFILRILLEIFSWFLLSLGLRLLWGSGCCLELRWYSSLWCLFFFGFNLLSSLLAFFLGTGLFLFLDAIIMIWRISFVVDLLGSIFKTITFLSIV